LPVDSLLDLGASCQHVELFGLDRDLTSGDSATVRLSFAKAGAVDLKVTVAGPAEPLTRSPLPDLGEH
jgi:copper(I)-binding protein